MPLIDKALKGFRDLIDEKDKELVELLKQRLDIVQEIGKFKKEYGVTTVQKGRWNDILNKLKNHAQKHDLDYGDLVEVWNAIHALSVNYQNKLKNET